MKTLITSLFTLTMFCAVALAQSVTSLNTLNEAATSKRSIQSNVPLAEDNADFINGADLLETGRIPNYVRAFALLPKAAKPFAATFKTYLYGGTIAPETKMAMGLRIAQIYGSPYPAIHLQRLLRASSNGQKVLAALNVNELAALNASEQAALRYAELLTRDISLLTDAEFQKARVWFNDAQLVELTMTTAFMNYFLRFCEGANLPVESWALAEPVAKITAAKYDAPAARIALVSDELMQAAAETQANAAAQARNPQGLGIGIANSQRAFLLVPDVTKAWRSFTTTSRDYNSVSREIKLHVSFAISMLNGCRY